ncbi:MAG TPA: hypothetical protein VMG12_11900 [Polyangiaceae bacterium]|nr:hypothetical protein [Polyangiaceae bacterium]
MLLGLWMAGAGAFACSEEVVLRETPGAPGEEGAPGEGEPTPSGAQPPAEGPAPASTGDEEIVEEENGQTGSLEPSQCSQDVDCIPALEAFAGNDAEFVLTDSACEHGSSGFPPYRAVSPECVCNLSVTRTVRWRGDVSRQTSDELFFLTNDERLKLIAGPQCLVGGDGPGACAYCDHEFPGCDVDSQVDDCAAPCADAVERMRAADRVAHEVELRVARCSDTGHCEIALRIDDDCYNQGMVRSPCSLGDEAIIAAEGERPNPGADCALPPLPCETAADCPAGLGCDGSICGPCRSLDDACLATEDGGCENDGFACASGEACVGAVCIRSDAAACVASAECPTTDTDHDPRACLLSSVDNIHGRGNAQARSYCASLQPNHFGLRVGDVLEARVLGPADALTTTFVPPLETRRMRCGAGTGLEPGAALRLRMEWLSASAYESDFWPRASLLDAAAPIESVPPAVHERDEPEGLQLSTKLSATGNSAALAYLERDEPTLLRGCRGRRSMSLRTLLDRRAPGVPPRADGTFPTTVLEYAFWVADEAVNDAACAELSGLGCRDTVEVELTRLTP